MTPLEARHRRARTNRTARRRRALYGLVGLVVLTAACSANAARATTTTTGPTTSTTSTTVKASQSGGFLSPESKFGTSQVGPADPTTSVPTERGNRPIDPANDAGQEVIIDKGGYALPEWLVAEVSLPITWTNLSGAPQQIIFDAAPERSPVIPPGGTYTWKSPGFAINLTYHIANGHKARLTLQNPSVTN
jgi:hypothetical protein